MDVHTLWDRNRTNSTYMCLDAQNDASNTTGIALDEAVEIKGHQLRIYIPKFQDGANKALAHFAIFKACNCDIKSPARRLIMTRLEGTHHHHCIESTLVKPD